MSAFDVSKVTIAIISILALIGVLGILSCLCLVFCVRRISRMLALRRFPKFGDKSQIKTETSFPQRQEMRIPKRIWNRLTECMDKLDTMPIWLKPPPLQEMPIVTKEGILGWEWDQNYTGHASTDYAVYHDDEYQKPIHYTRYIKQAFQILLQVIGNDRRPNESERAYIERKCRGLDRHNSTLLRRSVIIYEKAAYGGEEIEKREYYEFLNNLKNILKTFSRVPCPIMEHPFTISYGTDM